MLLDSMACANTAVDVRNGVVSAIDKLGKENIPSLAIITTDEYEIEAANELAAFLNKLEIKCENILLCNCTKEEIYKKITELNEDNSIGGIYLTRLNTMLNDYQTVIYSMISPSKDVSALNVINNGLITYNQQLIFPPLVAAVVKTLENMEAKLSGKHVVIVNRSPRFGRPLANALLHKNCTVTVCHSRSRGLNKIIKSGDIVISATGQPNFLTSKMLKKDAFVIDMGYVKIDNKIFGDVFEESMSSVDHNPPKDMHHIVLAFIAYNFIRLVGLGKQ